VGVWVTVGVTLAVRVAVTVGTLAVAVFVGVTVAVAVGVFVGTTGGVCVAVKVGVGVFVGVGVAVDVGVRAVGVLVGVTVGVWVDTGATSAAWTAANASSRPAPESRSIPDASMSRAVDLNTVRICAGPSNGLADFTKAAIAAACGAAADVPGNGLNPGLDVVTRSAAAMSGFWRRIPPVDEKFPGVMGLPSAR
jgi:hypothetical protein